MGIQRDAEVRAGALIIANEHRLQIVIGNQRLLDVVDPQRPIVTHDPAGQCVRVELRLQLTLGVENQHRAVDHQQMRQVARAVEEHQADAVGGEYLTQHLVNALGHRPQLACRPGHPADTTQRVQLGDLTLALGE